MTRNFFFLHNIINIPVTIHDRDDDHEVWFVTYILAVPQYKKKSKTNVFIQRYYMLLKNMKKQIKKFVAGTIMAEKCIIYNISYDHIAQLRFTGIISLIGPLIFITHLMCVFLLTHTCCSRFYGAEWILLSEWSCDSSCCPSFRLLFPVQFQWANKISSHCVVALHYTAEFALSVLS